MYFLAEIVFSRYNNVFPRYNNVFYLYNNVFPRCSNVFPRYNNVFPRFLHVRVLITASSQSRARSIHTAVAVPDTICVIQRPATVGCKTNQEWINVQQKYGLGVLLLMSLNICTEGLIKYSGYKCGNK
jgi:hypothetical protein